MENDSCDWFISSCACPNGRMNSLNHQMALLREITQRIVNCFIDIYNRLLIHFNS